MSFFKIIVPETTTNLILDPQFGAADPDTSWDITGDGSAPDVTRTTTDQWIGGGCALFDIDDGTTTTLYQSTTVTATSYTLTAMVKRAGAGTVSNTECQAHFDSAAGNWDSITQYEDNWWYCVKTGTATAGTRNFGIKANEDALLVDAVQLENLAYATTYCDGTLIGNRDTPGATDYGYQWNGTAHASTSTRHAQERSGGRVRDIQDNLGVTTVNEFNGGGRVDPQHQVTQYALLSGGLMGRTNIPPRMFDLALTFLGTGASNAVAVENLHANRLLFDDAIRHDLVLPVSEQHQPFKFWYVLSEITMELDTCYYLSGMNFTPPNKLVQKAACRFLATDPAWHTLHNTVVNLTVNVATTATYGGKAPGYPVLTIEGEGTLVSLVNSTLGKTVTFTNLSVLTEETITLDFRPGRATLSSSTRGSLGGLLSPGDVAEFQLTPGDNSITLTATAGANILTEAGDDLLTEAGGTLITSDTLSLTKIELAYQKRYGSVDGVAA